VAELKTKKTAVDVKTFLAGIADEQQRADAAKLAKLMQKATKAKPAMWGPSIVGFGNYRYVYDNGREMDWFIVGFAPRKGNLTIYGVKMEDDALAQLGKHKASKGCLHIKKMADVDVGVLGEMIGRSVTRAKETSAERKKG
jgi:Domain of unknown function (DU1801)